MRFVTSTKRNAKYENFDYDIEADLPGSSILRKGLLWMQYNMKAERGFLDLSLEASLDGSEDCCFFFKSEEGLAAVPFYDGVAFV